MINITPDGLKYLKNGSMLDVKIDFEFSNEGSPYTLSIYGKDIISGSFSLDRNSVSSNNIEIGNAETTELCLTLDNHDHRFDTHIFEGAVATVYIDINNEFLKMGIFIVDEPPKKLSTIKIKALDYMAKFNKLYTPSLVGSGTLLSILQDCCTVCNVTLYTYLFTNSDYVAVIPSGEDVTFHQVIIWIAELAGANAWINENGQLVLSWYGTNQNIDALKLTSAERISYEIDENDITISGLTFTKSDNPDYLFGTTDYSLVIEDNALIAYDDIDTVGLNIYNAINGYTYRPFSFSTIGLPYIFPMDIITIVDSTGVEFTSIVTNHKYTLNRLSKLQAKGETAKVSGYATSAPFTAKQKLIIKNVAVQEASTQVDNMTQATFNFSSLMTNSMGYFETIVGDSITGYTRYIHEKQILSESQYQYKQSSIGFGFSTDYGVTWSSGMTSDGNILGKILDVIGIRANWIKAGVLKGLNTERIVFDLDNDTLTIGYHLLDIEDDTLAFTSSVTDNKLDYIFKKSVPNTTCDMRVEGTFDTTVAFTWGICRGERRNDVGNEGIDFVF